VLVFFPERRPSSESTIVDPHRRRFFIDRVCTLNFVMW
jgi:hypothetical protein